MRIGLLADIHGNGHALISVLKSAKEKKLKNYYVVVIISVITMNQTKYFLN